MVEIGDGALKLGKVQIEMAEGRSTFATAVELATMRIDSEWQIEPKLSKGPAASPTRAFLPPVTVVYTGKLSQFAALEPQVSAAALERELVVRKMELDVGELERLRKLDEERARQDAARLPSDGFISVAAALAESGCILAGSGRSGRSARALSDRRSLEQIRRAQP